MATLWKAPSNVSDLVVEIKTLHHPHLEQAAFAVTFNDAKPFINNRLNSTPMVRY